jgi:phosphatidylglycerophosphatase A
LRKRIYRGEIWRRKRDSDVGGVHDMTDDELAAIVAKARLTIVK